MSGTVAGLFALSSLAVHRPVRPALLVAALFVPSAVVCSIWLGRTDTWSVLLPTFALAAAAVAWGMFIRARRQLLASLRDRARRAEAEQLVRAERARLAERTRIAREMHDVLAHRISQISMQAGAMAFREDLPAHELRRGAAGIQERANAALTDLRGVLGVLRDPETGGSLDRPQPTFADVPLLVQECRAAGMGVDYAGEVTGAMPDALGRTAYRIVQEGLTNAGKHAPGAAVRVRVAGGPDRGIEVTVTNPLGFGVSGTPGAGLGLVGLAERAHLSGGTLEAGPANGTFELHGWLPWAE